MIQILEVRVMRQKRKGKGFAHYAFKLFKYPLRLFLKRRLNVQIIRNEAKNDRGPFLVIGNHVTNYDPLIVLAYTKPLIRFVAASNNYDHWFKRLIFRLARVIAINKRTQDARTIREILTEVKQGSSIGVFPEGGRTWDGATDVIIYSTAKLIKFLKLPVYNQRLIGGYLSTPRWCRYRRKGRIDVDIYRMFTPEEIERLSVQEIYERLLKELDVNDYAIQRKRMIPFKGKNRAEYIERLLYVCPNCHAFNRMKSSGDHFYCQACGSKGTVNVYGFIEGDFPFDNLVDFNRYQKQMLQEYVHNKPFSSIVVNDVSYRAIGPDGAFRDTIQLTIQREGLKLEGKKRILSLPWSTLSEPSITFHHTLTIFEQEIRHQFIIEPYLQETSIVFLYEMIKLLRGENHDGLA